MKAAATVLFGLVTPVSMQFMGLNTDACEEICGKTKSASGSRLATNKGMRFVQKVSASPACDKQVAEMLTDVKNRLAAESVIVLGEVEVQRIRSLIKPFISKAVSEVANGDTWRIQNAGVKSSSSRSVQQLLSWQLKRCLRKIDGKRVSKATMTTWKTVSEIFKNLNVHYKCFVPDWYNNIVRMLQDGKFAESRELMFTMVFLKEALDDSDIQTTYWR